MAPRGRLHDLAVAPRLRRRTVRFRLTALYCGLFFPSGVALVFITYIVIVLVQRPNPIEPSVHTSHHSVDHRRAVIHRQHGHRRRARAHRRSLVTR